MHACMVVEMDWGWGSHGREKKSCILRRGFGGALVGFGEGGLSGWGFYGEKRWLEQYKMMYLGFSSIRGFLTKPITRDFYNFLRLNLDSQTFIPLYRYHQQTLYSGTYYIYTRRSPPHHHRFTLPLYPFQISKDLASGLPCQIWYHAVCGSICFWWVGYRTRDQVGRWDFEVAVFGGNGIWEALEPPCYKTLLGEKQPLEFRHGMGWDGDMHVLRIWQK